MTPTPVLIPVEEYLRTSYRPDCDYINGEVLERNMGEKPHARLQTFFARFLAQYENQMHAEAVTEQRVQVAPEAYRIPDVAFIHLSENEPYIVSTPPILCVEILSSKDRMRKIQERLDDYASMGVQAMWVIDPWRGLAYFAGPGAKLHQVDDRLTVPGTPIAIDVSAIFDELDRIEKLAATRTEAG